MKEKEGGKMLKTLKTNQDLIDRLQELTDADRISWSRSSHRSDLLEAEATYKRISLTLCNAANADVRVDGRPIPANKTKLCESVRKYFDRRIDKLHKEFLEKMSKVFVDE